MATAFVDQRQYFVSEASVYRLLQARGLITSPAFILLKAADRFAQPTTAVNQEASYDGEIVKFERIWSYPKPVQKPHPPVILGTFGSPQGRQRVADFGDGWIPIGLFHGDNLREDIADLGERLRKKGRDPKSVSISMVDISETSTDDLARFSDLGVIERAISRGPTEDRDTVLRWLDRYAETARRLS